jgi:hypothetical protein
MMCDFCFLLYIFYNWHYQFAHEARNRMPTAKVLRQRPWTDEELTAHGFQHFAPIKRLVMARVTKAITEVQVTLEVLVAEQGDIICYTPGTVAHENLDDYEHWPVKSDLFRQNYKRWDTTDWKPNEAEIHLMANGCRPYFKAVGVWALKLPRGIYVQSLESPEPVVVPAGRWLCIGVEGEPYNMNDDNFRARYIIPEPQH